MTFIPLDEFTMGDYELLRMHFDLVIGYGRVPVTGSDFRNYRITYTEPTPEVSD